MSQMGRGLAAEITQKASQAGQGISKSISASQSMENDISDRILLLRLCRIEQLNEKLTEAFKKERIPASRAASLIIENTQDTCDPLVPSVWSSESTKFQKYQNMKTRADPGGCCAIV